MKKAFIAILIVFIFMFTGCNKNEKNTFTAVIDSVSLGSIMVTTKAYSSFDKASVSITDKTKMISIDGKSINSVDFSIGDEVEIVFDGEIRDSYPVQITATKITVKSNGKDVLVVKAEYKKITAKQAKEQLDSDKSIILVDVRTVDEYKENHISGSILIPDFDIETIAPTKLTDKNAKILVYCRSGNRSATASKKLIEMGYTNVYDFGGIRDWPYETVSGE